MCNRMQETTAKRLRLQEVVASCALRNCVLSTMKSYGATGGAPCTKTQIQLQEARSEPVRASCRKVGPISLSTIEPCFFDSLESIEGSRNHLACSELLVSILTTNCKYRDGEGESDEKGGESR